MTMAFTLSELSCHWRVLSRSNQKDWTFQNSLCCFWISKSYSVLYILLLYSASLAGNLILALPAGLTSSPSPLATSSFPPSRLPDPSLASGLLYLLTQAPSCTLCCSQQRQTWLSPRDHQQSGKSLSSERSIELCMHLTWHGIFTFSHLVPGNFHLCSGHSDAHLSGPGPCCASHPGLSPLLSLLRKRFPHFLYANRHLLVLT